MLKSTLVAVGTLAILGSIGQNAQAVTDRIDRLLTPRSHLNLQAQVMMNNNKPGDGGNNPPPTNNPPPANPPPANNPPPNPGFDRNPLPIDRPGLPAEFPPGSRPGFSPGNFSNFNHFHYHGNFPIRPATSTKSKPLKVCGKGYRIVQGSLCERLKK
jgi:hypothetical protein